MEEDEIFSGHPFSGTAQATSSRFPSSVGSALTRKELMGKTACLTKRWSALSAIEPHPYEGFPWPGNRHTPLNPRRIRLMA
jgi:hypothetical protein